MYLLPLFIFILDQVCKFLARRLPLYEPVFAIGPFGITHFENTAGPFSLPVPVWTLLLIHFCVLLAVSFALYRLPRQRAALTWIFSGGVSNFLDRILFSSTTDYIALPFHGYWNLADVAVVIGILMLCFGKHSFANNPQSGA